jgi:signal peptidase I
MANRQKGHAKTFVMIFAACGALLFIALAGMGLYVYAPLDARNDSMSPTINHGDHFLFSKRAYDFAAPQLGDVIVFTLPKSNVWDVKRVVGLPGHRIQMIGPSLTINGDYIVLVGGAGRYSETLPNGAKYNVHVVSRGWNDYWTPQYLVPEGQYFVLGDNRDESVDSRDMVNVGFVDKESILGRVRWRFWDGARQHIDASAIK